MLNILNYIHYNIVEALTSHIIAIYLMLFVIFYI